MRKALLLSVLSLIAVQVYAADRSPVPCGGLGAPRYRYQSSYRGGIPHAIAPPRARAFKARSLHYHYVPAGTVRPGMVHPSGLPK